MNATPRNGPKAAPDNLFDGPPARHVERSPPAERDDRGSPLVSVVVPVFNRRDLIQRAVSSLLAQDFEHSFEIVVVDDGSTDGSGEAARVDRRVRVIRQRQSGSASARLAGIRESRAPYVAFLDSDDVALPTFLRVLYEAMGREPRAALVFGRMGDLEDPRAGGYEEVRRVADRDGLIADPLRALLDLGSMISGMNLLTRREIALTSAETREHVRAATDYDFVLRCALRGPFRFVDQVTAQWENARPDGISRRQGPFQAAFSVIAPRDAVSLSGRRDNTVRMAFRHRVEAVWPWAFISVCRRGEWRLASQLLQIGLTVGRINVGARGLYWALVHREQPR